MRKYFLYPENNCLKKTEWPIIGCTDGPTYLPFIFSQYKKTLQTGVLLSPLFPAFVVAYLCLLLIQNTLFSIPLNVSLILLCFLENCKL